MCIIKYFWQLSKILNQEYKNSTQSNERKIYSYYWNSVKIGP